VCSWRCFAPPRRLRLSITSGSRSADFGEGLHAFHFTAGLGYGVFFLAFVYQPRLIVGTIDDSSAIGMRNGLRGYYFADMVSLEVGHQFVHHHHGLHHDIHILLGVNPWALRTLR
jgi:hypothetical protein